MLTVVATLTLGFLLGRVWEIRKALRRQLSEAQHSMTTRNPDRPDKCQRDMQTVCA